MRKLNILFFGNGSSENHGCEAIILTCLELLKNLYSKAYVGTLNKKIDFNIKVCDGVNLIEYHYEGKQNFISKAKRRLFKIKTPYWFDNIENILDTIDLAISIGGDNYCYNNNDWLYYLQDVLESKKIPTVLLGCSIDEIDETMQCYLQKYSLIIARETLTYNLLSSFHSNVELLPDPAFSLKTIEDSYTFENGKNYIGINLSPLILNYETNSGLAYKNFKKLIHYILNNTKKDILLIPHVVFNSKHGDIEVLEKLKKEFNDSRIRIAYTHDCRILKYYISKCDVLIAARTHASIAAYSSNVPCLVLGYSNKSIGIAKDLFGTDENYVIPINNLKKEDDIIKAYLWIEQHRNDIISKLTVKNNEYESRMKNYELYITELFEKTTI